MTATKPELTYNKGKGGVVTSARLNGEFCRLRTDWDWERLEAKLAALGWRYDQDSDDIVELRN